MNIYTKILIVLITATLIIMYPLSSSARVKSFKDSDWYFNGQKGDHCVVVAQVFEKHTNESLGKIQLFKSTPKDVAKAPNYAKDVVGDDFSVFLDSEYALELEKGVGMNGVAKNHTVFLEYRQGEGKYNNKYLYVADKANSAEIIKTLLEKEELTFEYKMRDYTTRYGVLKTINFKKHFDTYKKCIKTLNRLSEEG